MSKRAPLWVVCALLGCLVACRPTPPPATGATGLQFSLLEAAQTGIDFRNDVPYSDTFNCYLFRNFYNGGGAGLGDINNDGLLDVFLCGNMCPNRLYLNLGNWKFRDITESSGMGLSKTWTAGVAFADVNGDGHLDIYTCKSGPPGGLDRYNQLFINVPQADGLPHFEERAREWHLDNTGLSTHAAFFDYDRDGDLDCYLLNNSLRSVGGYDYRPGQRNISDPAGGNKLLRNDGPAQANGKGGFRDVTQSAGIYSSAIGFGLGVTVGDYDRDGWQDLFISNDFFERDYLYHNEGDGSFKEVLTEHVPEISKGSMGADMADVNNDAYPEIFVTEMTPPDDARYKTKASFDDWNTYQMMQQTGYHRQFGRNVLQMNQLYKARGEGSAAQVAFAEIGRQAGVAYTDWSWGALIADFDNDGWKDIFVANGIGKDLLDQDYVNFYSDPAAIRSVLQENPGEGIKTLIDKMPAQPIANYLFRQSGQTDAGGVPVFENIAASAGLGMPSFSNGSAYGDIDNDGDLDLVVNNVNMPCFVYRNDLAQNKHSWLKINLEGEAANRMALGAKVRVTPTNRSISQYIEVAPMRGFESCTDPRPNFGLGEATSADVEVTFLSGKTLRINAASANQILHIREADAQLLPPEDTNTTAQAYFSVQHIFEDPMAGIPQYSDFDREPLLFRMYSADSPAIAVGDVNGDGLDDYYLGGQAGVAGNVFCQQANGAFVAIRSTDFERDKASEDTAAAFFDADNDGDADLYVGSGSSEFSMGEAALQDRLYLNDGKGRFVRSAPSLPGGKPFATACVCPNDVDRDGDIDLFVGMRLVPGHYGQVPQSFILLNEGAARFRPALQAYPTLSSLGMVSNALWADIDSDSDADLIVAGDWEPVRLFRMQQGALGAPEEIAPAGWWNCIAATDADQNGSIDLIVGNHGLNSRFRASAQEPMNLWISDFDNNGRDESILCQYNGGISLPLVLRNDLVKQMPGLKKQFLKTQAYTGKGMDAIFNQQQLRAAQQKQATELRSMALINVGSGKFEPVPLPAMAQISPTYSILAQDFTGDGIPDLLLGSNHSRCKPEVGQHLAARGILLAGIGKGQFRYISQDQSGLNITGSIRDIAAIRTKQGNVIAISRSDAAPLLLRHHRLDK